MIEMAGASGEQSHDLPDEETDIQLKALTDDPEKQDANDIFKHTFVDVPDEIADKEPPQSSEAEP